MSVKTCEVFEVRCDAFSPRCMFAAAYDSETPAIALERAKAEGWRTYGNQVFGYRHKCPECIKAKAALPPA